MIEPVLHLQKRKGETPLACMERFRADNPEYVGVSMTYAGRLDPIAAGELLVLTGEECKKKDEYLGLDKEYEATVLVGFQTDSYDILGLPFQEMRQRSQRLDLPPLRSPRYNLVLALQSLVGKFTQTYPSYSSKTVAGKQLHQYARAGEIDNLELPTKEVEVYSVTNISSELILGKDLKQEILETISLVKGDFRQDEIREKWEGMIEEGGEYQLLHFTIQVSSGTYIRSIAHTLGGALLRLHRTRIFGKM